MITPLGPGAFSFGVGLGHSLNKGIVDKNDTAQNQAYWNLINAAEESGVPYENLNDLISYLEETGELDTTKYSAEGIQDALDIYNYERNARGQWKMGQDIANRWNNLWNTKSEGRALLQDMAIALEGAKFDAAAVEEMFKNYKTGGANAPSAGMRYAAAPNYDDVNFENFQFEVDPVKLWTGQELADLHNINYNPDYYYDLIKRGTTAEIDRARFESALMNEASMVQDTANITSYLDNIRNTKAEALSSGATAGAQAAAEVLKNKEAINSYAQNQASVANARFNAVDAALEADANARLTANDYFNNLAATLGQDILTLYANDTDRYGQEWISNSELYKADQELRGQRAYNNASMWAAQATANSAIDALKVAADSTWNEYAYMYDKYKTANGGNSAEALNSLVKLIRSNYYGYDNFPDYYLNEFNK